MSDLQSPSGPAYNKAFQQMLVVHLCKCAELLRLASDKVTIQDFELGICQVVWEAVQDYWRTYNVVPGSDTLSVHVLKVMKNADGIYKSYVTPEEWEALAELMGLISSSTDLNPEYYLAEIPKYLKYVRASKMVVQYRTEDGSGADPAMLLRGLTLIEQETEGMMGSDDLHYVTEQPDVQTEDHFDIRITTGISRLDSAIDGGLRPGDLGCITACPGTGKTNVLLHLAAVNSLLNVESLVFSLELPGYKVKRRYLAMTAGIPADTTKKRIDLWSPEETMRLAVLMHSEYAGYNKCMILDRSTRRVGLAEIEDTTGKWKEKVARDKGTSERCLLVCVDWLQYIDPPSWIGKNEKESTVLTAIAKELGRIGRRQNVAMWTANQGTREADGKTLVRMKDQANAYHIGDALDISIGLALSPSSRITEEDLLSDQAIFKSRLLTFNINKNRENSLRAVELFQAPTLRFFDAETEYNSYMKSLKDTSFNFKQMHRIHTPRHLREIYEKETGEQNVKVS